MRHRAEPIWWIAVGLVVALARCIDTPVERQRICEATSGRCFYVANTSAHGSGSFTNPYGLPDLPSAATPYCALGRSGKIGRAHVELQSQSNLVCRLLLEKKKQQLRPPPPDRAATPRTTERAA